MGFSCGLVIRWTRANGYRYGTMFVATFGGVLIAGETAQLYGVEGTTSVYSFSVVIGKRRDVEAGEGASFNLWVFLGFIVNWK